ncbi:MAG: ABC transporter substrate-binding protein [Solirubrobacteraceae bacterium]
MRTHRYRTSWSALAAVAIGSLVIAGCGSSSSSKSSSASSGSGATASSSTLRIGDQAGTGAEALLQAAGLINKLPFQVKWADFTSGPPILQAMNSGSIDVGGVGDAPPAFSAAAGGKIAIVAATQTNPAKGALLVPKGSSITSISQLKGKKIAVAQGSSAHYHLLTVLNKAGLTVHDVTIDYLQPAQALAAFSSGSVDAWDIWSPFVEEAVAKDHAKILVNGNGYGSNYSYVVASRAALENSTTASEIRTYVKLLGQAQTWANTHQQAFGALWSKATGLPTSITDRAAADSTAKVVPINAGVISAEQGVANAFSKAGLIPLDPQFSKFVYTGFNGALGAGS